MRAITPLSALALSLAWQAPALAASGQTQGVSMLEVAAKVLAALASMALLYVIKSRPQRMVKVDAQGHRYDPNVRGLFDD